MNFVQEVDVLHEKVEHRDDDLLPAAIGHLGPLCGPLQGRAVVAEVAGWVHVVLWAEDVVDSAASLRPAQVPLAKQGAADGEGTSCLGSPGLSPQEIYFPAVSAGGGCLEAPC